ncbi:hypothetical protein DFH07DRAFT_175671 [Mycena maculata]|uniref:Uncharacterized protein n=1 Tax=Mycena maculata TaxID=230809 RepID=A0AAD7MRS8_9AGAR|nr:hypothetical protein DFH07DRAFT_175671 [Mycena maculata]
MGAFNPILIVLLCSHLDRVVIFTDLALHDKIKATARNTEEVRLKVHTRHRQGGHKRGRRGPGRGDGAAPDVTARGAECVLLERIRRRRGVCCEVDIDLNIISKEDPEWSLFVLQIENVQVPSTKPWCFPAPAAPPQSTCSATCAKIKADLYVALVGGPPRVSALGSLASSAD